MEDGILSLVLVAGAARLLSAGAAAMAPWMCWAGVVCVVLAVWLALAADRR